jgi:hypothetical protein
MSLIDSLGSEQSSDWTDMKDEVIAIIDNAINLLAGGDVGAHWEPETIDASKLVFSNDKALFQRKRNELKNAGGNAAQITDWTKAIKSIDSIINEDTTNAGELVTVVTDKSELFHNARGNTFATFEHDGHKETWALGSTGFTDWLGFTAYTVLGFSPSESAIKQALTSLSGIAKYDGEAREVFMRAAPCDGGYMIDLGNDQWQTIKVTDVGWTIINEPEVRFTRSSTSSSLPIPTAGNLSLLWKHVNVPKALRPLLLAFILESWRPDTAYTVLAITGGQGSAKSSTHTRIRQLSDPNEVPLRSAPKTVQDVYVSAANNHQASFENMSNLSNALQDALCTLSTGGGFASRKLYSDNDESVIEVKRPIIINSITTVTTRPDLIDRTLSLCLPKIDDVDKKRDSQLDEEFERDAPQIIAGLLDLFVETLKRLPHINIERPPRMIDFAYLGEAMNQALGAPDGEFNRLYRTNRSESLANSLDSSPAALAVHEMMNKRRHLWEGTVGELKAKLDSNHRQDGEGWPKSPRGLSDTLRRMSPALSELGINIEFLGHQRQGAKISITLSDINLEQENNRHNYHSVTKSNVTDLNRDDVTHVIVEKESKKMPEDVHMPPFKGEI